MQSSGGSREDQLLGLIHVGGDDELGDPGERRIVAQGVAQLPAAHDGHHQVEQDDAGPHTRVQKVQGLLAVGGLRHGEAVILQGLAQALPQIGVVLDHEDLSVCHGCADIMQETCPSCESQGLRSGSRVSCLYNAPQMIPRRAASESR